MTIYLITFIINGISFLALLFLAIATGVLDNFFGEDKWWHYPVLLISLLITGVFTYSAGYDYLWALMLEDYSLTVFYFQYIAVIFDLLFAVFFLVAGGIICCKKKYAIAIFFFLPIAIGFGYNSWVLFGGVKSYSFKISYKVAQIKGLRNQLEYKLIQIGASKENFYKEISILQEIILSQKENDNIDSFEQAIENQAIANNLSLIRHKLAYASKLEEIEFKVKHASTDLGYLSEKAVDDLRMVNTISEEEAKNLVIEINAVVEKYRPESDNLTVQIDENQLPSLEAIWQDIISENPK